MTQIGESRRQKALEIIERNARSLTQLVAEVIDVSGIVMGKTRLTRVPADLLVVARQAADVVRPALNAKRIRFSLVSDDSTMTAWSILIACSRCSGAS